MYRKFIVFSENKAGLGLLRNCMKALLSKRLSTWTGSLSRRVSRYVVTVNDIKIIQ